MMLSKKQTNHSSMIDDEKIRVKMMLKNEHSLSLFLLEHIKQDVWIKNINNESFLQGYY